MLDTAFTLLNTPVTWLEVIAFFLAIANIVCNVREIHWAWPLTVVASVLYAWLFFASKLYGEAGVNIFFAATAFWGWWQWLYGRRIRRSRRSSNVARDTALRIERLDRLGLGASAIAWLGLWGICTLLLARWTDSDVAWADGFVTAGSIVGTLLLGRKFIENWPVWLVVNAASVALFFYKNLLLTALLYVIFFAMAIWGWRVWIEKCRAHRASLR
jgi:nicotinamide mononucleotide transporter